MSLPGASHDPYDNADVFFSSLERNRGRNDSILTPHATAGPGRIYQSTATSGNAQAHYGDRIMYGDSHVHYHREAIYFWTRAKLTFAAPSHEAGRPAPPRRPINTLRWRRDPHFVGREDILGNIKQVLEDYGCVALTGAGGVGLVPSQYSFCPRSDKLE